MTPSVPPGEVLETTQLPRGFERLGEATASCRRERSWSAFQGRSLVDVDCTERRLRLMLRETASQSGANVLAELRCETNEHRSRCAAVFARGERVRPSHGSTRLRGDVHGIRGSAVRVDFAPVAARPARPPRDDAQVRELPWLPPSHVVLGSFTTECTECSELETRAALRLAAGRLGASDVIGVRCHPSSLGPEGTDRGFRCLGAAAVTRTGE